MAEAKTKPTEISMDAFLDAVEPESRRAEGRALDALFRRVTGWAPRLWGPSMVGYGRYCYTYESGRSGESFATGFSPRKAELVVYVMPGYAELGEPLGRLGRHRMGKSCLYIKRLSDVDTVVLEEIVRSGLAQLQARWPVDAG
jgi:hypothetical protein